MKRYTFESWLLSIDMGEINAESQDEAIEKAVEIYKPDCVVDGCHNVAYDKKNEARYHVDDMRFNGEEYYGCYAVDEYGLSLNDGTPDVMLLPLYLSDEDDNGILFGYMYR